ncbi:MAG TPA: nucleotidyl transferase AbiEii/AbiGii toxin family protein [Thermodesulfovibrionales bacterium]|nr:nucleotidyl transferase AbiEii/AbiGii toxin family protein [Thermodesulfovibrionales bacterium]
MSSILFNLSGKIDQHTVEALSIVKKVADSMNIPFFVVGASARDYILKHCYGIEPPRMTRDIDLGVEVASWEQFNQLKESLIATGKFSPGKKEPQRFLFDSVIVDIVPFGPIADKDKRISWPPEHEIFMSMLGFKEAYEYSITVRLSSDPELDIKLPTLPGLALMKVISWKEKYPERKRDAEDLLLIMQKYEYAGNFDRLYAEEQDLLQEEIFDTRLAGIRLLGRDMARIADPDTLRTVKTILDSETGERPRYRLVADMIRSSLMFDANFEHILLQVEKLRQGIVEP